MLTPEEIERLVPGQIDPADIAACEAQTELKLLLLVYRAGHVARHEGVPLWACPYATGTVACRDWIDGWIFAKFPDIGLKDQMEALVHDLEEGA